MMGSEGLKLASKVAILNANYIAERLKNHFPILYKGSNGNVAHECIIDIRSIKSETGVTEEDISKRVWDHGKEVYVLPEPEIIHEHGGSKKENEIGLRNEFYISYKKLMFKHYSKFYSVVMLLLMSLKIFRYFLLGRCKYETVKLALKGFPEEHSLRYKQ